MKIFNDKQSGPFKKDNRFKNMLLYGGKCEEGVSSGNVVLVASAYSSTPLDPKWNPTVT